MKRMGKGLIWCAALLLLIYLIQLPVQQTEETWAAWSLPLSSEVIVIDPGHGGSDGGAVRGDSVEKEIALSITKKLQRFLQQAGAVVYLTREIDTDLASDGTKGLARRKAEDIRNRLAFIEEKQADLFLSVHLNALPSGKWSGAQTFFYPSNDENRHLARMVQSELIRNLGNTTRQALAIDGIYLLKHAEVPGALVEVGFLSNETERNLLETESYQEEVAASIYLGVLRYVTEEIEEVSETANN